MNSHFIPFIGGERHLQEVPATESPQAVISSYKLTYLPQYDYRPFYLHSGLNVDKLPSTVIFNWLYTARNYPPEEAAIWAKWYTSAAIGLAGSYSWLYINPSRLFDRLDRNNPPSRADFSKAIGRFLFKERLPILRTVLQSLTQAFPHAFIAVEGSPKGQYDSIIRKVKPLAYNLHVDLYNKLQPANVAQAELMFLGLSYYCNSNYYLLALARGRRRIDLNGNKSDEPTVAQRRHAVSLMLRRGYNVPKSVIAEVKALSRA